MSKRSPLRHLSDQLPLEEVVRLRSGKTPSRSFDAYWNGETPWYSAKDLKRFRLRDSEEHISEEAIRSGAPLGEAGDLLILVRGMTLLRDVPVCLLEKPGSFNQDLKLIKPSDKVSGEYLGYMLSASKPRLMSMVTVAGHGTGRLEIDQLMQLPVWVPEMKTQRYVAEQLGLVEKVLLLTQQLIEAKREFKRGLAQQLLNGQKRFRGFEQRAWVSVEIGELLEEATRQVQWNEEDLYTLVSVRRRSGGVFFRERKRGADIKVKALFEIQSGDILISTRQVVHGAVARVTEEFDGAHVSGEYMVLVPKKGAMILPEYFEQLSMLPRMYYLAFLASYGIDIEKLTFNPKWYLLSIVRVPPTIEEQRRIADALSALDCEIDLLEAQRKQMELYKRGILSRLLSGEIAIPV